MNDQERATESQRMERLLRTYVDGCNEANVKKVMSCLTSDAIHYYPPGMYGGPWRSAARIAEGAKHAAASLGSHWVLDQTTVVPDRNRAVAEWTHFKTKEGKVLRGAEYTTSTTRPALSRSYAHTTLPPQTRNSKGSSWVDSTTRGAGTHRPHPRVYRGQPGPALG